MGILGGEDWLPDVRDLSGLSLAVMATAHDHFKSDDELQARETLMREQFVRDVHAWADAVPVDDALGELDAIIDSQSA